MAIQNCLKIYNEGSYKVEGEGFKKAKLGIALSFKTHLYNLRLDSECMSLDILGEGRKIQQQLPENKKFAKLKKTIASLCEYYFTRTLTNSDNDAIDYNYSKKRPMENKTKKEENDQVVYSLESMVKSKIILFEQLYEKNKEKAFTFATTFFSFNDEINQKSLEESLVFFLKNDPSLALKLARYSSDRITSFGSELAKKAYHAFLQSDLHMAQSLAEYCQTQAIKIKNSEFYRNLIKEFKQLEMISRQSNEKEMHHSNILTIPKN